MRANKRFLYVVGCSWSAKGGNPYHGYTRKSREKKIESEAKLKWQRILSDKLNLELINDAVVGGSNDMSIRKLRNFILHDERSLNSIIIWQWTELSRYMIFSRQDNVFCHINTFEQAIEIPKELFWKSNKKKLTFSEYLKQNFCINVEAVLNIQRNLTI